MPIVVRKTTKQLSFKEGKPRVHTVQVVRYPNITSEQLVDEIVQTQGITKTQALSVIEAYINRMVHYMEIGHGVKMGNFGIFKPTINSKSTDDASKVNAGLIQKKRILFYPGKDFRRMLSDMQIVTEGAEDEEASGPVVADGDSGTASSGNGGSSSGTSTPAEGGGTEGNNSDGGNTGGNNGGFDSGE